METGAKKTLWSIAATVGAAAILFGVRWYDEVDDHVEDKEIHHTLEQKVVIAKGALADQIHEEVSRQVGQIAMQVIRDEVRDEVDRQMSSIAPPLFTQDDQRKFSQMQTDLEWIKNQSAKNSESLDQILRALK